MATVTGCDSVLPESPDTANVGVYHKLPDADKDRPGLQPYAIGAQVILELTVRNDGNVSALPPIVVTDSLVGFNPAAGDSIVQVFGPRGTEWTATPSEGVIKFVIDEPMLPKEEIHFVYEITYAASGSRRRFVRSRVVGLGNGQSNDACAHAGETVIDLLPEGTQCTRQVDPGAIDVWISGDPGQDNGEDLYALATLLSDPGINVVGIDAVGWRRSITGAESPQHCDPNPPGSSYAMYRRFLDFFDYSPYVALYSGSVCEDPEPSLPRNPGKLELAAYPKNGAVNALVGELADRIVNGGSKLHYVATGTVTNLVSAMLHLRDDPGHGLSEARIGSKLVVHMEAFDFTAPFADVHLNMMTDPMAFKVLFEWDPALVLYTLPTRPDQVSREYGLPGRFYESGKSSCADDFLSYMALRRMGLSGDFACGDPSYLVESTSSQLGGGVMGYLVSRSRGGTFATDNFEIRTVSAPVYNSGALAGKGNFDSVTGGRIIQMYRVPEPDKRLRIRNELIEQLNEMPCGMLLSCTSQ